MKKFILLSYILFIFAGCGKQNISIPKWYINSTNNNTHFIYGTGEGYSLSEAKNNALNDMSSRLIVSVGSVMNSKTTSSSTGTFTEDVTRDMTVETKKIKFNNAIIEKTINIGNTIYTLMKVDRIKLFNEKKRELLSLDNQLEKQYNQLKKKSILEQIFALQDLKQNFLETKNKAKVLYAINNSFNYNKYVVKYNKYLAQEDKLKSDLVISIKTNDKNRFFADIISEMLNQNNYKISNKNVDIQINLNNKIRYSTIRGWKIAKVTTTISVISDGKTLSNKIINVIGRSGSTNENALNSAAKYFKKEITKRGINGILFAKK